MAPYITINYVMIPSRYHDTCTQEAIGIECWPHSLNEQGEICFLTISIIETNSTILAAPKTQCYPQTIAKPPIIDKDAVNQYDHFSWPPVYIQLLESHSMLSKHHHQPFNGHNNQQNMGNISRKSNITFHPRKNQ